MGRQHIRQRLKTEKYFTNEPRHTKRALSVAVTLLRNDVIFLRQINRHVFVCLKSLLRHANTPEQCKISELVPDSRWAIHMFIFKITEVKFCMTFLSLSKYRHMTLAVNDGAVYTPC